MNTFGVEAARDILYNDRCCGLLIDPTRPIQNTYLGSDDYLRARFEEYIMSLLSSVKYAEAFDPKNAFKSENSLEDVIRDEEKGTLALLLDALCHEC